MFFGKKVKAQGTIEYLVILAVIVIVSLIVVSLLVNSTSGAEGISSGTSKIGGWTNTISVTESAISPDGNYLVRLANNTGEPVTIKTVKIGDQDANYSEDLFQGNQQNFKITSDMVCELGQTVVGELVVTYVSQNGLEHTEVFPADITFECNDYIVNLLADQCPEVGEGGCTLTGNAVVSQVKTGSTFYSTSSTIQTGTGTQYLSPDSNVMAAGYYDANNLSTIDSDLNSDSILSGVTIFGITGTASAGVEADFHFSETKDYFVRTEVSGQGIATDSKNGLIWQDGIKGSTCNHANAISYCAGLNWGGFSSGWRLPTVQELMTLVDHTYSNSNYFPSVFQTAGTITEYNMWSNTTVPSDTSNAYFLYSNDGDIYSHLDKTGGNDTGVRCVRSES